MKRQAYISGIGGWLWFLILQLMILGPLLGLGGLHNEFSEAIKQFPHIETNSQWQTYKQISWTIFAATAGINIAAGFRLWKIHAPESVNFAIISIWLAGPLGHICYVAAAYFILGEAASKTILLIFISTISSCLIAGLWTIYLMRSIRVKNTYRQPGRV